MLSMPVLDVRCAAGAAAAAAGAFLVGAGAEAAAAADGAAAREPWLMLRPGPAAAPMPPFTSPVLHWARRLGPSYSDGGWQLVTWSQ